LQEHILKVAGRSARVLFENASVRVIIITMRKGQRFGPHSYLKGISYNLDGGKIRAIEPDGKSSVVKFRKGEASWTDDGESLGVENLGRVFRMISVELKA
jgi:hypothetical protein